MKRTEKVSLILVMIVSVLILPGLATAYGSYSGDQQYGDVGCHDQESPVMITMESSPSSTVAIQPRQELDVWVNVTGEIEGEELGVLIASTTGSYGSLPMENGWAILEDPSGVSMYNYWNAKGYDGDASFHWSLEVPEEEGPHPIYARVVHAGDDLYSKAAGPMMFYIGDQAGGNITVDILEPYSNESVTGQMQVTASIVIPNGSAQIDCVDLIIGGQLVSSKCSNPYSWSVDTKAYENGPVIIEVVVHDDQGHDHSHTVNVTVENQDEGQVLGNLGLNITAGVTASLAFISALTLLVLWARNRLGGGS